MKDIKTAIDVTDGVDGTAASGVKQLLPYEAPKLVILGAGHDTRGNKTMLSSDETGFSTYFSSSSASPS